MTVMSRLLNEFATMRQNQRLRGLLGYWRNLVDELCKDDLALVS